MRFGIWNDEMLATPEQQKRQYSALDKKLTPISIDREAKIGLFKGSKGIYCAALDRCDCMDFVRNYLPCKHMYRLAMELGVIPGIDHAKTIKAEQIPVDKVLEMISDLSEDDQKDFGNFCYHVSNDNKNGPQRVRISLAKKLDNLGLIEMTEDVSKFSERRVFVKCILPESISANARRIHLAIYKKFPDPYQESLK